MNSIIKVSALALMLAAGAAIAQQSPPAATGAPAMDYSKLDTNGDGVISKDGGQGRSHPVVAVQHAGRGQGRQAEQL